MWVLALVTIQGGALSSARVLIWPQEIGVEGDI